MEEGWMQLYCYTLFKKKDLAYCILKCRLTFYSVI